MNINFVKRNIAQKAYLTRAVSFTAPISGVSQPKNIRERGYSYFSIFNLGRLPA